MRKVSRLALTIACFIGMSSPGNAQQFPTRTIKLIIPAPPGGPTNSGSRILARALSNVLGQSVVTINRPGALTIPGTAAVAEAEPDGYTIGGLAAAGLTSVTALGRQIPYQIGDFAPLGIVGFDYTVITTSTKSSWRTIQDAVAQAKQQPGALTYGSAGVGSINSFGMEMLKQSFGVKITHVPFQGTGPTNKSVLGGYVNLGATSLSSTLPLIQAGDLRALAVSAPSRLAVLPNVPTFKELANIEAPNFWLGLFAPAKTPTPVLAILTQALARVLKDEAVLKQLEIAGIHVDYIAPEAATKMMAEEVRSIAKLAKTLDQK